MDLNGITLDLNRITRREFRRFLTDLSEADGEARDELTGQMVEKVVTTWPYNAPITQDGYLDLPLADSLAVDRALTEAMSYLSEKPGEKK